MSRGWSREKCCGNGNEKWSFGFRWDSLSARLFDLPHNPTREEWISCASYDPTSNIWGLCCWVTSQTNVCTITNGHSIQTPESRTLSLFSGYVHSFPHSESLTPFTCSWQAVPSSRNCPGSNRSLLRGAFCTTRRYTRTVCLQLCEYVYRRGAAWLQPRGSFLPPPPPPLLLSNYCVSHIDTQDCMTYVDSFIQSVGYQKVGKPKEKSMSQFIILTS